MRKKNHRRDPRNYKAGVKPPTEIDNRKAIYQLDFNGEIIKRWDSISEVLLHSKIVGLDKSRLINAVNSKEVKVINHIPYYWIRTNEYKRDYDYKTLIKYLISKNKIKKESNCLKLIREYEGDKTPVVFRRWKGEVIAIFPYELWDREGNFVAFSTRRGHYGINAEVVKFGVIPHKKHVSILKDELKYIIKYDLMVF